MRMHKLFVHFLALLALPVLVVWWNLGLASTLLLLALWLLSRWFLTLQRFRDNSGPELILESIPVSHFVEKVRWCMERAGFKYVERANGATLGAFFAARTVPVLWVRTGSVKSSIGNSEEILRYLWGRYGHEAERNLEFLKPTTERVNLERRLDKYGQHLQVWIYHHALPHRDFMMTVWGARDERIPAVQRALIQILFPLLRVMILKAFRINETGIKKSNQHITELLSELNNRLATSEYLVGSERSYVDYAFASLSALWVQPAEFGNGKADGVRVNPADFPPSLIACVEEWTEQFPHAVSFINKLYATERTLTVSK